MRKWDDPDQRVSTGAILTPPGILYRDTFDRHNWVDGREGCVTKCRRGHLAGRSQDSAQHPTAGAPKETKTQPAQNALSAQAEKPCSSPLQAEGRANQNLARWAWSHTTHFYNYQQCWISIKIENHIPKQTIWDRTWKFSWLSIFISSQPPGDPWLACRLGFPGSST